MGDNEDGNESNEKQKDFLYRPARSKLESHPVPPCYIYIYKKEINYLFLDGASMPTLVIVPPVSVN